MVGKFAPLLLVGGLAIMASNTLLASEAETLIAETSQNDWSALATLGEDQADQISGIACGPTVDGGRTCVVVYDERRHAALLDWRDRRVSVAGRIQLLDHDSENRDLAPGKKRDKAWKKEGESDLEAVAYDGGRVWVFGSHSRKKNADDEAGLAEARPSRRHLYRFPVDAAGQPDFAPTPDVASPKVEVYDGLLDLLATIDELRPMVTSTLPVADGGLNIEGATVIGGRMVLGFRGMSHEVPETDGALIVSFDADAVFTGRLVDPQIARPRLGPGIGIRDLVPLGKTAADGFMIVSGAAWKDDAEGTRPKLQSALWFWPGHGDEVVPLGLLPFGRPEAKPEALLILGEDGDAWRVLVLNDGVTGGDPAEYRVPKPPRPR